MRTAFKLSIAALAIAAGALLPSPARAGFTMVLDDGAGNTATITDIGGGNESIVTTGSATGATASTPLIGGALTYLGTIGSLAVTVTTGVNDPSTPTDAGLHLNTVDVNSSGSSTLTITLTKTDFTLSTGGAPTLATLSLASGGTVAAGGSFSTMVALDTSNSGLTSGVTVTPVSAGPFGPGAFSTPAAAPSTLVSLAGGPPTTNPFSLSIVDTLVFGGSGTTSADTQADAIVPEPGTLAILASGLPLFGFVGLRRRRAKAKAA